MSTDEAPITFWENPAWFGPKDLALTLDATKVLGRGSDVEILEIGVWEGSWLLHMARNAGVSHVTGIDPYPGLAEKRQSTLERFDRSDVRLTLHPSWLELPSTESFDLIHVDGEHSEAAAYDDLIGAATHLRPSGLIVVDDWMQPAFPGVNSAVHRFLRELDFRAVLLTEWKVYITRTSDAAWWREGLHARLRTQSAIPFSVTEGEGLGDYRESRRILGEDVIVCLGKPLRRLTLGTGPSVSSASRIHRWLGWVWRRASRGRRRP